MDGESSIGIPQGDVHKTLIYHHQQIFSYRKAVSLNYLMIGLDIDLVCPTNDVLTNIAISFLHRVYERVVLSWPLQDVKVTVKWPGRDIDCFFYELAALSSAAMFCGYI